MAQSEPCRLLISNCKYQTCLVFSVEGQASFDGVPLIANESHQTERFHQPDQVLLQFQIWQQTTPTQP